MATEKLVSYIQNDLVDGVLKQPSYDQDQQDSDLPNTVRLDYWDNTNVFVTDYQGRPSKY